MSATPTEVLRGQIAASGESLYKVAKGAGVTWNVVKRFADGGVIGTDQFDKLATYFGLVLTEEKKPKKGR